MEDFSRAGFSFELDSVVESLNLGPLRADWDDQDDEGSVATSFGFATRDISDLDDSCADLSGYVCETAPTTASDSFSFSRELPASETLVDDSDFDFDQLLQSLLLRQVFLDDQSPDEVNRGTTLRDMRRTGALGDLSQDAQMTLLGGTLYEYNEQGVHPQGNRAAVRDTNAISGLMPASQPALQGAIRHSLNRILNNSQRVSGLGQHDSDIAETSFARLTGNYESSRSNSVVSGQWLNSTRLDSLTRGTEHELVPPVLFSSPSRTFGGSSALNDTQSDFPRAESVSEVASDRDEEGVFSVVGLDSPRSARSLHSTRQDQDFLEETTSIGGLGDTMESSASNSMSMTQTHEHSLRTALGESFSLEGLDGGLADVLNRLAFDNLSLDESLSRSMRRVMQIGTILTGEHLSEDEISALPKVRFDQAEQQNCAICLEVYQRGELLTSLSCHHFFHVDCLAGWFRRSTHCPLCRQDQAE